MIEEKVHKSRQRSRGKRDDGTPNPVDIYVGERVRLRRHLLGLSQQELSRHLGICPKIFFAKAPEHCLVWMMVKMNNKVIFRSNTERMLSNFCFIITVFKIKSIKS